MLYLNTLGSTVKQSFIISTSNEDLCEVNPFHSSTFCTASQITGFKIVTQVKSDNTAATTTANS